MGVVIVLVVVLRTPTVLLPLFAMYTRAPLGVTATASGVVPLPVLTFVMGMVESVGVALTGGVGPNVRELARSAPITASAAWRVRLVITRVCQT